MARRRDFRALRACVLATLIASGCAAAVGPTQAKGAAKAPRVAGAARPRPAPVLTLRGLVAGPSAAVLANNGASLLADDGAGLIGDSGLGLIANNGGSVISNNGGGVISDNGGGLTAKTKYRVAGRPGYALAQAVGLLAPVPSATVELVDAAGAPLTTAVTTDAAGRYTLVLPAGLPAVAFVRARCARAGYDLELAAATPLAQGQAGPADVTPSTTLVAKKVQALVGAGLVRGDAFAVAGVREAADAVAPYMSELAVAAAGLARPGLGARAFDAMMGASPPLAGRLAEIGARTGIPFVLGQSGLGDGGPATATTLNLPVGVAFDPREPGAFVVVDRGANRLRRVDAQGLITTIAGTGKAGHAGDGGPAARAELTLPEAALYAANGDLYVADGGNKCVRRIGPDGRIETVVGEPGSQDPLVATDHADARQARLQLPAGLAWDHGGRGLFITDQAAGQLWRFDLATGALRHVGGWTRAAHGDLAAADGGPADGAQLAEPRGLAVDLGTTPATLYLAEKGASQLRRIDPAGVITRVALAGAEATLRLPQALALGAGGELFVADRDGHRVAALGLAGGGPVRTVVGRLGHEGSGQEPGGALAVGLSAPEHVAFDPQGRLVVCDTGHGLVLRVEPDGALTRLAGQLAVPDVVKRGRTLVMNRPAMAVFDGAGHLYVSDAFNAVVRKVAPDGTLAVVAGTGEKVSAGDGGPATAASFEKVGGLAFDREGRLLIGDGGGDGSVRRVEPDGRITTVARDFNPPGAMVVDAQGTIYVSEPNRNRVTAIAADGTRTVVIGASQARTSTGDGGPAAEATVNFPVGLTLDARGDLYVCEVTGGRVRKVALTAPGRPVSTVLAGPLAGGTAPFVSPGALAFDPAGRQVVVDAAGAVYRFAADGTAEVLAGPGGREFAGSGVDDGLSQPTAVVFEPDGGMWIVDSGNNQLKYVPADRLRYK